jgi:CheY-like chemotaxis protein
MGGSGSNPSSDEDQLFVSPSPRAEQAGKRREILIIEDNPADVYLIRAALETPNIQADLYIAKDGEQAIRFFDDADSDDAAPCPSLIILDINLPRKQGGEVLQHMRQSRRCSGALVIAASTSDSMQDREAMRKLGVNAYFRKPSDYAAFMKLGDVVLELLGGSWKT